MLTVHLWKEWREQRLWLVSLVAGLAVIAVGVGLLAPKGMVPADTEAWFVIVGLGAGLVALAGDLVPGEHRRGQWSFTARAPGGLRASCAAKLMLLFGGLAALLTIGYALGALCLAFSDLRGSPARVESLGHPPTIVTGIAIVVFACAPWCFTVSTWLARGSSVLPATGMVLAAVSAPTVLLVANYRIPVSSDEILAGIVLVFVGGVIAAWLSMVRGLRHGRRWSAALHGLGAAAVFVLPSWVWCVERVHAWHRADPADTDMRIVDAMLGAGGGTVFLSVERDWQPNGPSYALAVDVGTGACRQIGASPASLFGVGAVERHEWLSGLARPQALIGRYQFDGAGERIVESALLDGANGAVLHASSRFDVPPALRERIRAAARLTTPFELPDGRRAWFEGRSTVTESPDGSRVVHAWPDDLRPGFARGFGFWWAPSEGSDSTGDEWFDLGRGRTIDIRSAGAEELHPFRIVVRPGSWLLRDDEVDWLWDPDTGTRTVLELRDGEEFAGVAGDGRLVVFARGRGAALLDPESGRRDPLVVPGGLRFDAISPGDQRIGVLPLRTPHGADVYAVRWRGANGEHLFSFALREDTKLLSTVAVPRERFDVVALADEDTILVHSEHSIERWRFGSDEVQVLFSVGSPPR